MWFTKENNGFRAWFHVESDNGSLRTSLVSGDFTATIVDPADSISNSPSISESATKAGLYNFLIPSSFLTTNGVGDYGVVVEIDTFTGPSGSPQVRTALSAVLSVSVNDFDDLATQTSITSLAAAVIAADLVVGSGSTDTVINTNATAADDFYNGLQMVFITTAGTVERSVARQIDDYSATNGAFTVGTALPFTPVAGERVIVLGRIAGAAAAVDTTAIAIAVWARSILLPTVGSYGELVNEIGDNAALIPASL